MVGNVCPAGDFGSGRWAGRGAEEAFGVCRTTNFNPTRLLPRGTGPADLNAPSGASTAGPVLVNRRSGAVACVLQSADSGSAFVGGVVSCVCPLDVSEALRSC